MKQLYALKTPGVCVQLGELGVFDGPEGLEKVYGGKMFESLGEEMPDNRGFLFFHPNECPYVEVARDLKTAKGVWITDGMECGRNPNTGQLDPHWAWGSYGVDFINEDGEWKFWHFHIYRLWAPHYNTSWVEWDADANTPDLGEAMKPDRPGTDDYPYRANEVWIFKPDPPEPYDTWDELTSYIPNS
jgi:hypothetical protein